MQMEVEREPLFPGARTLRSCFLPATWGLISSMSVGVSVANDAALVPFSAPERLGARTPFSQHHPAENPRGAVGPPGPLTLWPAPRLVLIPPAWPRLPGSPLSPPPPTLPDLLEPRPEGAPASAASTVRLPPPTPPHFLIRGQSQPCGRVLIPPPHSARALGRAALPSRYLRPRLAPNTLSPAPILPALKEKHTVWPSSCLQLLPGPWSDPFL